MKAERAVMVSGVVVENECSKDYPNFETGLSTHNQRHFVFDDHHQICAQYLTRQTFNVEYLMVSL